MAAPNIETIVSLSKRRGFVFPSSEIYGGLGSAWDYGPLGVELCNNVKQGTTIRMGQPLMQLPSLPNCQNDAISSD